MEIKPGKYPDLSNEDYHGHTTSFSRSAIMEFAKNPKKYWANYVNPLRPERKATPAMVFGEQFHQFILEPEKFEQTWCRECELEPLPKITGLLKDLGREEYDKQKHERAEAEKYNDKVLKEWEAKNKGKQVIKSDDYATLVEMRDALKQNEKAWYLIEGAQYETSYFWNDKKTGLLLKARPDILFDNVIVDLKTTRDASFKAFQRSLVEGSYHVQAAMIIDAIKAVEGREINSFVNIAIEKEYPYSVAIYILDTAAIEAGREKYKSVLVEMKKALESGVYEDYGTAVMGLPAWAND